MKLLFLVDIAVEQAHTVPDFCFPTQADLVLANLEGAIIAPELLRTYSAQQRLALYNAPEVVDLLRQFGVGAVWLANNHVFDFPLPIMSTVEALAAAGINSFGAGSTLKAAAQPLSFEKQETTVKLFAYGWDVIGCLYATRSQDGVNPLEPERILRTIESIRTEDPFSCIVFVFHWNYELELYPQPAHRQLAHDLIDAGVDAVVGLHPHIAQGAEIYQNKPIIYSLGNWFFPERQLGSFKLSFPPISSRQLALELIVNKRQVSPVFHWYQFDQIRNVLTFEFSENIEGPVVRDLTPFTGLSHNKYVQWFRTHRKRKRGLPIYRNYNNKIEDWLNDRYVGLRQQLITFLVQSGIKRGVSG